MSTVIIEHEFPAAVTASEVMDAEDQVRHCMSINGAHVIRHYLARDGLRCVCVFEAPDAEALRRAFRTAGEAFPKAIWPATVHAGATPADPLMSPQLRSPGSALALVERAFVVPTSFDEFQAIENVGADCLSLYGVSFLRSYFSLDRTRMICLYEAPDAEAVRAANRQVGLPFERAWAATIIAK